MIKVFEISELLTECRIRKVSVETLANNIGYTRDGLMKAILKGDMPISKLERATEFLLKK